MVQLLDPLTQTTSWTLEVQGLEIRKGDTTILRDLSWQHQPGAVAWVVGENGAGKSSLLRILAGRDRPTAGSVSRAGRAGESPRVVYYHPGMSLPDFMTVRDWQRFIEKVVPAAARYPIDPRLITAGALPHKRVERLSTGEAKRLALVALLSRDTPFIFLDEPFEHLSREGKDLLATHLSERAVDRVIVVTTNQEIPAGATGPELRLDGDRMTITSEMEL
jgi:ABC-type multidrug transport system ATPase subunit